MTAITISESEFGLFQKMIYEIAGIKMSDAKKSLVSGRLAKRLSHYNLNSYSDYYRMINNSQGSSELQIAVDLLTTNETYFFREPKHFEYIRDEILSRHQPGRKFRVWSAACSSGEEAYTLAMVMADCLGASEWEIVASDISNRVLEKAQSGHYPMERVRGLSQDHLSKYCLKGVGKQEGTFLVDSYLRKRINFKKINLNNDLPVIGEFDLILLRNVMIYFDKDTKVNVVSRILPLLKNGGHLIISHSESLHGITNGLSVIKPSIYRK